VVLLRPAGPGDQPILEQMLALAARWRYGPGPGSLTEVLATPALVRYVTGWPRPGDAGVVAEGEGGECLGAAWIRLFPADQPGFGFVSPAVPELSIAVVPDARGAGIGGALLDWLIAQARRREITRLSLSVEHDNPALRLYTRKGFTPVAGTRTAATMVLVLAPD